MSRAKKREDSENEKAKSEFQISSFSTGGSCVAVARFNDGTVKVHDTKDISQPALAFTRDEWVAFVKGVRNKEFDVE